MRPGDGGDDGFIARTRWLPPAIHAHAPNGDYLAFAEWFDTQADLFGWLQGVAGRGGLVGPASWRGGAKPSVLPN